MYIKNSSGWKQINEMYIKVTAGWKKVTEGYIKTTAGWKKFWSGGTLAPQNPVTISQSTNGTTYLITLTGTNYSWTPGPPSLTYYFEWSTNGGTTWTQLSSGTAINPSYGSSTSYTYQIATNELSPNVTNTYRFRVYATYGSQTTNSSATTSVQGPTNITLTAGTAALNSVPLSWTSSLGAGRYMVYYDTFSPPTTLYTGTSSLSTTVSGLSANTLYYFKVTPITGLTNNTGYSGNNSNVVNTTTLADLTNTVIPTISGTLTEGQTVSMSNGSWNLTPDSYSYQWLYYNGDPASGYQGYVAISGATSSSYTIPTNYRDVYGQYIRAKVTAVKSGYTTTSAYSSAQTVAYDVTIPDPPTGLSVSDVGTNRPYGNAAYSLSWTAPANTGGVALSGYKIQFQVPSTGGTWYDYSANTVDTTSTSFTATGFGSNLSTNFRVYSVNSAGSSASPVTTASAVLGTTVPQAPTIGTASSQNTYISVTYTANATGGKAISSYTATSSPGSLTGSTSSGGIVVSGVTHNTAYTFTVTATNANGTSAASSASNTAYGVNIGSVTVNSSSSTSSSITLNFTQAANSTGTRGFLSGSLDGSTSGTSYLFAGLSPSTAYSLGLAGTAIVNGVTYQGPTSSGTYSTTAIPAPTVNSYPSISGTGAVGTNITFASGSYNNASTITKSLMVSTSTSFSTSSGNKGSTSPYTVTASDAAAPAYYFATLDTVVGTNGSTYYFWSGGYSGSSATIPQGSGSILSYNPNVAPSISSSSISPSSGTAGSTIFTASASVSGTPTPTVTYQWQYLNTSFVYTNVSGATSSSYTPPSNFNTLYPNYGFYCLITATNSVGSATARPTATLNSPPAGVAPSAPTGLYGSNDLVPTGGHFYWTASSTGTAPITYYYTITKSTTLNGTYSAYTSSSTTGTSVAVAATGFFKCSVYASNSYGSSSSTSTPTGTQFT